MAHANQRSARGRQLMPTFSKLCQTLPTFTALYRSLPSFVNLCRPLPTYANLFQHFKFSHLYQPLLTFTNMVGKLMYEHIYCKSVNWETLKEINVPIGAVYLHYHPLGKAPCEQTCYIQVCNFEKLFKKEMCWQTVHTWTNGLKLYKFKQTFKKETSWQAECLSTLVDIFWLDF